MTHNQSFKFYWILKLALDSCTVVTNLGLGRIVTHPMK